MKRKLAVILSALMLFLIGCEAKSTTIRPDATEVKPVAAFEDRKFIYNNGIKVTTKEENTKDEKGVKLYRYYPVISGLKDITVQEKINKELKEVGEALLGKLEADFISFNQKYTPKINQKNLNAYISYNCNNVIFVEYNANIDVAARNHYNYPNFKSASYGYDLNTGERIGLDDIFKPGYDYTSKINNFICQYLIENNYDDYETNRMLKPFQGIRKNQSFSFDIQGLRIIIDEKNDEFVNNGYFDTIRIPLEEIGSDLYIFDKYFDTEKNIYEKEKLSKRLLPNKLEFKVDKKLEIGGDKYFITITQGRFINVPNKAIEEKLNELVKCDYNISEFENMAKEMAAANKNSHFGHFVNLLTNAGGYLSVAATQDIYMGETYENNIKAFNYDFNSDKEMLITDIYSDTEDLETELKRQVKSRRISVPDEQLDSSVKEAVNANKFYFDEYGVVIYYSPEGIQMNGFDKWIWLPFAEMNQDKVKFLN